MITCIFVKVSVMGYLLYSKRALPKRSALFMQEVNESTCILKYANCQLGITFQSKMIDKRVRVWTSG